MGFYEMGGPTRTDQRIFLHDVMEDGSYETLDLPQTDENGQRDQIQMIWRKTAQELRLGCAAKATQGPYKGLRFFVKLGLEKNECLSYLITEDVFDYEGTFC